MAHKKARLVRITWEDAMMDVEGVTEKEARERGPFIRHTVGFLVSHGPKRTIVASTYDDPDNEHGSDDGAYAHCFQIPTPMIQGEIEYIADDFMEEYGP